MCDTAEHHAYAAPLPDFSLNSTHNVSLVSQINPVNPNNSAGFYGDLWAEGDLVAIGTQQGTGVAIVDISNPASPTFQSYYNPSDGGKFKDVVIRNNIGYFALDNNGPSTPKGIHIVDLANPRQPMLIGKIQGSASFQHNHNIFVDGNFLYAAPNDQPRVRVYDIANPDSPALVREFATTNTGSSQNLHDLTVKGGKLYTSNTDNGFTDVYNVSNMSTTWSSTANKIASFNVGPRNHSNDVTADGNFVICCRETENGDCQVWSLMTPGTPVKIATINKDTIGVDAYSPHNPVIAGDKLYVSWYQAGVQVFDFADPANPEHLGGYDTFAGGRDTPDQYLNAFGGNWGVFPFLGPEQLLVSDMESGLFVLDASAVPEPAGLLSAAAASLLAIRRRWQVQARSI